RFVRRRDQWKCISATFLTSRNRPRCLEIGDYWSIPLERGQFACGRVIGRWPVPWRGNLRRCFRGPLECVAGCAPTRSGTAGSHVLQQGAVHIKTIIATGGAILGNRPLELDNIAPGLFIEYPDNRRAYVFRGMDQLRIASANDIQTLPTLSKF